MNGAKNLGEVKRSRTRGELLVLLHHTALPAPSKPSLGMHRNGGPVFVTGQEQESPNRP
jgi:hypothetical protein